MNKRKLYESIMTQVSKQVKQVLNERQLFLDDEDEISIPAETQHLQLAQAYAPEFKYYNKYFSEKNVNLDVETGTYIAKFNKIDCLRDGSAIAILHDIVFKRVTYRNNINDILKETITLYGTCSMNKACQIDKDEIGKLLLEDINKRYYHDEMTLIPSRYCSIDIELS